MKIALTALLLVVALGVAFQASAQSIEAKVPFAFRIGDRSYEAGTYTVSPVGSAHYILQGFGRSEFLRAHNPSAPAKDNKQALIFQCYDKDCALMTVRLNNRGFTLPKSDWQAPAQIQVRNRVEEKTVVAQK